MNLRLDSCFWGSALRSAVLTGSHLWPLGVQEAVLIGTLEMEESCLVQMQQRGYGYDTNNGKTRICSQGSRDFYRGFFGVGLPG